MSEKNQLHLTVSSTLQNCPIGDTVGNRYLNSRAIPVLSCEGACIRFIRLNRNREGRSYGYYERHPIV